MIAGRLRHKITIQSPPTAASGYGDPTGSWTDFATVSAGIAPASGGEGRAAKELQAETDHIVTIRYLPGVNASMRIVFGTRIFDILFVKTPDERNEEMEILCKERA